MGGDAVKLSFEEWGTIIGSIYEAAFQPDTWNDTLIQAGRPIDCHAGQLTLVGQAVNFQYLITSDGPAPDFAKDFEEDVAQGIHPRVNNAMKVQNTTLVTDYMHTSERQMKNDPWYQGNALKAEVSYYGGLILEKTPSRFLGICFMRGRGKGHFQELECEYLRLLTPHFKRSMELMMRNRLRRLTEGATPALENFSNGVVVLDRNGQIAGLNRKARTVLKRRDGLFEQDKYLKLSDPRATMRLKRELRGILAQDFSCPVDGCYIQAGRIRSPRPYLLMVTPLSSEVDILSGYAALVTIDDPEETPVDLKSPLMQLYGLTRAEAGVVEALYEGKTLKEIAEERCVSVETPRYHLKNSFHKMDVSRQSEVVRLASQLIHRGKSP